MADVEEVLVTRLGAQVTLVSNRVYPLILPQSPTLPALTYQGIGGTRIEGMTEGTGLIRPHLQIDAWGETYESARDVIVQVEAALDRWADATTNPVILDCFALREPLADFERETRQYRVSMDFEIWHRG